MKAISIHVENGQISGRAPSGLPDGDFEISLVQPEDEMSDEELAQLELVLERGIDAVREGRTRPAADLAAELLRGR